MSATGPTRLPVVFFDGVPYFRDDRLREFRCVTNPHERITYDELCDPPDEEFDPPSGEPGPSGFPVELVRVHAQEEYAVIIGRNLYFVGIACNGKAGVLAKTLDWNRQPSRSAEAQAVAAVLKERGMRARAVAAVLSCECGGAP